MSTANLTADSLALFDRLANDAPNWSGSPMVDVSPAERGNLTQLKRAKLLTTFVDEGIAFADFTPAGVALATERGITGLRDELAFHGKV